MHKDVKNEWWARHHHTELVNHLDKALQEAQKLEEFVEVGPLTMSTSRVQTNARRLITRVEGLGNLMGVNDGE